MSSPEIVLSSGLPQSTKGAAFGAAFYLRPKSHDSAVRHSSAHKLYRTVHQLCRTAQLTAKIQKVVVRDSGCSVRER